MKEGLHARYGPTQFEDFFGDLTKYGKRGLFVSTKSNMRDFLVGLGG